MARAEWGSRLGFVLAAAGSAIGLGAIWKFPYITAQNGGGAFLLIFLLLVFTLGISLMIAEMLVGSVTKKSPVGAYRKLGGPHMVSWWVISVFCAVFCPVFLQRRGWLDDCLYRQVGRWCHPDCPIPRSYPVFSARLSPIRWNLSGTMPCSWG